MPLDLDRRELIALAGIAGLGFAVAPAFAPPVAAQGYGNPNAQAAPEDLFFIHIADVHWGFRGESVNPDPTGTLRKVVDAINALSRQPDFVIFTGDMTHVTEDAAERRRRMAQVRDEVGRLRASTVRFVPGDHDAIRDRGEAYRATFGEPHYSFEARGYHCVVLDNATDPDQQLGQAQLTWLAANLSRVAAGTPVIAFTHRPLFELYRPWGWFTPDGPRALELLAPHRPAVFYGHVHQEHHAFANGAVHHAAASVMFPLPGVASRPERLPVDWDAARPYRGMGWNTVSGFGRGAAWDVRHRDITG